MQRSERSVASQPTWKGCSLVFRPDSADVLVCCFSQAEQFAKSFWTHRQCWPRHAGGASRVRSVAHRRSLPAEMVPSNKPSFVLALLLRLFKGFIHRTGEIQCPNRWHRDVHGRSNAQDDRHFQNAAASRQTPNVLTASPSVSRSPGLRPGTPNTRMLSAIPADYPISCGQATSVFASRARIERENAEQEERRRLARARCNPWGLVWAADLAQRKKVLGSRNPNPQTGQIERAAVRSSQDAQAAVPGSVSALHTRLVQASAPLMPVLYSCILSVARSMTTLSAFCRDRMRSVRAHRVVGLEAHSLQCVMCPSQHVSLISALYTKGGGVNSSSTVIAHLS